MTDAFAVYLKLSIIYCLNILKWPEMTKNIKRISKINQKTLKIPEKMAQMA